MAWRASSFFFLANDALAARVPERALSVEDSKLSLDEPESFAEAASNVSEQVPPASLKRSTSLSFGLASARAAPYEKYPGKACFPGKGAVPLDENHDGDHELPGWPTYEACKKACDDSVKCKAFTRQTGATGLCWLRENVNLYACMDVPDIETHAKHEVVADDATCLEHTELTCKDAVAWTFRTGKLQSWAQKAYGKMEQVSGVSLSSAAVEDFQRLFFCGAVPDAKKCELPPCTCSKPPCNTCGGFVAAPAPPPRGPSERVLFARAWGKSLGYKGRSDCWVGADWCEAQCPSHDFNLNAGCSEPKVHELKVLTYNLFWWHLFGVRGGADRMAGKLVEKTGPWDFIGFQECDNMTRIMDDSRILDTHVNYNGTAAVSIAWAKQGWNPLAAGYKHVSEDSKAQYYGRRVLVWSRLAHMHSHKTVLFLNFHGALPVNRDGGGMCGGEATAYNILRVISEEAHAGDAIILVGDFNAEKDSKLLTVLAQHLTHSYQGRSFNGVDNFFTNQCVEKVSAKNLGNGGSDHDALGATFKIR